MPMNLRELKEIFRLVEKTDFTEVEVTQGDWKVRIGRGKEHPMMVSASHVMPHVAPLAHAPAAFAAAAAPVTGASQPPVAEAAASSTDIFVTSPFVGTFYRAPSPDADPYVKVGQTVRKGQILCIIEAMKLMNELECDYDGKIVDIYPENGKPVEFGAKLFRIEPIS
jgi:acetyl-CoA carboxylase biotin carboxyl carrier protein